MTSRSEPTRSERELGDALDPNAAASWAIASAHTDNLAIAYGMLYAQILSRRADLVLNHPTPEQVDEVSRQISRRVERIRLIVAELRRRGLAVEWEE